MDVALCVYEQPERSIVLSHDVLYASSPGAEAFSQSFVGFGQDVVVRCVPVFSQGVYGVCDPSVYYRATTKANNNIRLTERFNLQKHGKSTSGG